MHLTRFTDYSLRVLIYLGLHPSDLATISEIAQNYSISHNHLMKVVRTLAASGYIETLRGKGGGMRLARPPELINVGDVVRDTEENLDIVECFNDSNTGCPLLPSCALKSVLTEARKSFLATLDLYTLADLLASRVLPVPLRRTRGLPSS
jgi:Rrf2 family nitric oxide-sensitive transcriptional repressor